MASDTVLSQLLKTTVPWATATDSLDVSKLPTLSNDERTNAMLWNTIGTTTATAGVVALLKVLAHKRFRKKWDKKSKDIVESKLNSLYPITAPNYEEDLSSVSDVRRIGLSSIAKQADAFIDGRGLLDWLKDNTEVVVKGAVPVAGALTAGAIMPVIVDKLIKKREGKRIDAENLQKRNQLAALQAKLIDLGLSKKADGIAPLSLYLGSAGALGTVLTGLFAAKYFSDKDKNRKIMKALEELSAENSTNIPQRISLKLNSSGRPAVSTEDQKYIKELLDEAAKADKEADKVTKKIEAAAAEDVADFSDKVTKDKKEELFS